MLVRQFLRSSFLSVPKRKRSTQVPRLHRALREEKRVLIRGLLNQEIAAERARSSLFCQRVL